ARESRLSGYALPAAEPAPRGNAIAWTQSPALDLFFDLAGEFQVQRGLDDRGVGHSIFQEYNCTGYIATNLHLYLLKQTLYYGRLERSLEPQTESERIPIRESPELRAHRAVVAYVSGRMVEPRQEPKRRSPRRGTLRPDLRLL